MRTKQCKACPWRKDVDPHEIPNGYSEDLHCGLENTIAEPGVIQLSGPLRIMACHESSVGKETPCVGWLANQLGPGNNIALRLWARKHLKSRLELVGEQHECFEDTLPEE
jgi:hypothetical protein